MLPLTGSPPSYISALTSPSKYSNRHTDTYCSNKSVLYFRRPLFILQGTMVLLLFGWLPFVLPWLVKSLKISKNWKIPLGASGGLVGFSASKLLIMGIVIWKVTWGSTENVNGKIFRVHLCTNIHSHLLSSASLYGAAFLLCIVQAWSGPSAHPGYHLPSLSSAHWKQWCCLGGWAGCNHTSAFTSSLARRRKSLCFIYLDLLHWL